jgi:hypothetical protein
MYLYERLPHFTCFTSTKLQMLTPVALRGRPSANKRHDKIGSGKSFQLEFAHSHKAVIWLLE